MIEAIRLNHEFIEHFDLVDLGRINIVCGKNSSGKSTLVHAIANSYLINKEVLRTEHGNTAVPGKTLTVDFICGKFIEANSDLDSPGKVGVLNELISKLIQDKQIWFFDEASQFKESLNSSIQYTPEYSGLNHHHIVSSIEIVVNSIFSMPPQKVLAVQPNRSLVFEVKIVSHPKISVQGDNIVQSIFSMKNQLQTSDLYLQYQSLYEAFQYVTNGVFFDFRTNEAVDQITLLFSDDKTQWFEGSKCGLGLQDLLLILYFATISDYDILIIEEPESHLHPELQRRLLAYLKDQTNKQYFFTTHSNIFLDTTLIDRAFLTSSTDKIRVTDVTSKTEALNELGYTIADNLVSDLVILVEGPHDKPIIEEFLVKMDLFDKYNIKIWPLGGDNMKEVDLSVFAQNYNMVALIDNDPESGAVREAFVQNCTEYNIPVTRLNWYSIECYFTADVYNKVFKGHNPRVELTEVRSDTKIDEQLGFNPKRRNRALAKESSLQDIEDTDLHDFLVVVESILKRTQTIAPEKPV